MPDADRRIIHVDMDAFFASVEQRDNPDLRGKPVVVGHDGPRGVVAAASYEARVFGVRSAMPSVKAARLCPGLIFVPPRFDQYRAVSAKIRAIFADYTPLIEPLSLDEAYLDLTGRLAPGQTATRLAREIRDRIRAETGLTASAGISYNKFLAKIASDQNKPDGQCVITPDQGPDFVLTLPVGKFHGIGPATVAKMAAMGIASGADLRAQSLETLTRRFGKAGRHYWHISRGIDLREVRPDRIRKSIGAERTYSTDLHDPAEMTAALDFLAGKVWEAVIRHKAQGRTVTLKLRYGDFRQITRAHSLHRPVADQAEMLTIAKALLSPLIPDPRGVRLLGITLSALAESDPDDQPDLFARPV
ncbi:MAG: DNA polymerase IV [Paracoccus sp. (in: a-proteobacteria)]|uniref:DNA polymerase IV n=1 Tax=Paracoccus sp. TaxID=267 RepID=UPI0026E03BB2|nr:DNA polymerase IV [Paracoccus sp. (in: a-proteobacteria)]MDO5620565.1 DNA polymerase IV [Paracoccus sp. (in: a-proteobacteria)]